MANHNSRFRLIDWFACLIWAALALWTAPSLAIDSPSDAVSPPVVTLRPFDDALQLPARMQVFEDVHGQATLSDVRQAKVPWRAYTRQSFQFGSSRSVYWARVRLFNADTTYAVKSVVDTGDSLSDFVDFYVLDIRGLALHKWLSGDRRPFGTRPIKTATLAFPIDIGPGQWVDVYIRFAAYDGLHPPTNLQILGKEDFFSFVHTEAMVNGLYFGLIVALFIYNGFLFASTRQGAIGYYVLYVGVFLGCIFSFRGFSLQYLWPDSPDFNNQFIAMTAVLAHVTVSKSVLELLKVGHSVLPVLGHRARFIPWMFMLPLVPAVMGHYAMTFFVLIPLSLIGVSLLLGMCFVLAWRGSRTGIYTLLAFLVLAVGAFVVLLKVVGLVPSNAFTKYLLQIGSAMELLLLAFGLADQINTLQASKQRAEQEALRVQQTLNHELDSLVKSRTLALEQANDKLQSLSITDELTGAYNRRYFNEVIRSEPGRFDRSKTPFVLCIFDVDNFKAYNDIYGHQAGDEVLQRVVRHVQSRLRRAGDKLFRVGGEEFCIILDSGPVPDNTVPFIEDIRLGIQALGIEHKGGAHGVVTASFGMLKVDCSMSQRQRDLMYSHTDKLLYEAKHAGRNRVVVGSVSDIPCELAQEASAFHSA